MIPTSNQLSVLIAKQRRDAYQVSLADIKVPWLTALGLYEAEYVPYVELSSSERLAFVPSRVFDDNDPEAP